MRIPKKGTCFAFPSSQKGTRGKPRSSSAPVGRRCGAQTATAVAICSVPREERRTVGPNRTGLTQGTPFAQVRCAPYSKDIRNRVTHDTCQPTKASSKCRVAPTPSSNVFVQTTVVQTACFWFLFNEDQGPFAKFACQARNGHMSK